MSSNWMFTKKDKLVIKQINHDASSEPETLHHVLGKSFFTDCAFFYDDEKKEVSLLVENGLTLKQQKAKFAELHCLFYLMDFLISESYVVLIPLGKDDYLKGRLVIWKKSIEEPKQEKWMNELTAMCKIKLDELFISKFSFLLENGIYATPKLSALIKNKFKTVEEIRFFWNFRVSLLAAVAAIVGAILAA